MWTYCQTSGALFQDGDKKASGYSGHMDGRNNPVMQDIHSVGPIPQGLWCIIGPPQDTPTHGPFVLHLEPMPGTETFGRSGFLMHGDSVSHLGEASLGCIIMDRPVRELVWNSGDRSLTVVEKDENVPPAC